MPENEKLTPKEITSKIEDMLDEMVHLLDDQSSINYISFNQHRRIVARCKEISEFFE